VSECDECEHGIRAGRCATCARIDSLRDRVAELEADLLVVRARLALAQRVIDLMDAFMLYGDASAIEPLRAARAEWDRGET